MIPLNRSHIWWPRLLAAGCLLLSAAPALAWQAPPSDVVLRVRYWSPMALEDLQMRGNGAFRLETRAPAGPEIEGPAPSVQVGRVAEDELRRFARQLPALCKVEPYRDSAVHGQTVLAARIAPAPACVVRFNGRGEYARRPNAGLRALGVLLAAVRKAPATDPALAPAYVAPIADVRAASDGPSGNLLRIAWYQAGWQLGEVDLAAAGSIAERTVFDAGFSCRPMKPETIAQLRALSQAALPALCRGDRPAPKAKGLAIQLLPSGAPPGCHPEPLDLPTLKADPARAALWEAAMRETLRACSMDALLFAQTLRSIPLGLPPHRD